MNNVPGQDSLTKLLKILVRHFDEGELRTLCFDLGVDYDALPSSGKENKARELISYLQRRGGLRKLVERVKQLRPNLFPKDNYHIVQATLNEPQRTSHKLHLETWQVVLGLASLAVAITTIIVSILIPEIRHQFGLDSTPTAQSYLTTSTPLVLISPTKILPTSVSTTHVSPTRVSPTPIPLTSVPVPPTQTPIPPSLTPSTVAAPVTANTIWRQGNIRVEATFSGVGDTDFTLKFKIANEGSSDFIARFRLEDFSVVDDTGKTYASANSTGQETIPISANNSNYIYLYFKGALGPNAQKLTLRLVQLSGTPNITVQIPINR